MEKLNSHKIFFGIAIIGIIMLSLFTYMAVNSLESSVDVKSNSLNFYKYYNLLTKGNFILFAILLLVANIMYIWQKFWDTFIWTGIIFLAFTIIDWFWLSEMIFHYKKKNHLWQGETNLGYIIGFLFAFLSFCVIVFNYLILKIMVRNRKNKTKILSTDTKDEIRTNK